MSLEADLIAKFGPLFNGNLHWDTTPDGWKPVSGQPPLAIMQRVGGPRRQYVDDKEQPEFLRARVQFWVWGASSIAVAEKMEALQAAVMNSNTIDFYGQVIGEPMGDSNEVLKLRGLRQDFMFAWRNPLFVGP